MVTFSAYRFHVINIVQSEIRATVYMFNCTHVIA